ncbi:ARM repeat-containing protein [Russula earlei]|uniref:ARM repeat-containing protein n=1 Tax=Russula earlei TaxID=71964 RepID=A0ACC0UP78_9AGAM|nr:ARM repeat-containing protein [Russula earlei]
MAVIDEADTTSVVVPSLFNYPPSSLPEELSYLITSFIYTHDHGKRSKAFLVLASYCQGVRASAEPARDGTQDPGTQMLSRIFLPVVQARVADTQEADVLAGLSFLTALFQVDWQTAAEVFRHEAVLASITDILDLYPSELVSREAARLFSQACGHKACRSSLPIEINEWLETAVRQKKDLPLRAIAAVAITKLSRGAGSDGLVESANVSKRLDLAELMKAIIMGEGQDSSLHAVEGLAYLSVEPIVKEDLSKDTAFLKKLFSVVPRSRGTSGTLSDMSNHSLIYGMLNITYHLSAYRPPLSPDQEQIMKLRRMTKSGTTNAQDVEENPADVLDDDPHVKERGRNLVKNGALDILANAIRLADSVGIRITVGRILLNLSVDKENRGKVLQSGGAKTLAEIIRKFFSATTNPAAGQSEVDVSILEPIQALAKLAITSSPTQVFGPDPGAIYDAIRPFAVLLTHSASSLLQRFEAIMALTNLSSHGVEAASRVAHAEGLLTKIEFLMLEDHVLIRRAATELTCNLVAGSENVFKRYSEGNPAKSRLQILVALSDVDDLPTRLAASGALASLTSSPDACRSLYELEQSNHRVLPVLTTLIAPLSGSNEPYISTPPDHAMVHRGVVCIRNFFINLEPNLRNRVKETDLTDLINGLTAIMKGNTGKAEIIQPTAEVLKSLMDLGVVMPGI